MSRAFVFIICLIVSGVLGSYVGRFVAVSIYTAVIERQHK